MSASRRGPKPVRLRLPLPSDMCQALEDSRPDDGDNLGLWLDKLVRVDENDDWDLRKDPRVEELERLFCPSNGGSPRPWRSPAAAAAVERMGEACDRIYGRTGYRSFTVAVRGRLLVDYGRASALETSLSLHPVLGCPRIPGSALKGLLRGWLREDARFDAEEQRSLLGAPDAGVDGQEVEHRRGRLVIHDALPVDGKFQLAVDVLTPHAGKYYRGEEPPADWLEPVPHTFLTVVETRFRMFVGLLPEQGMYWGEDRPSEGDERRLDGVVEAIYEALEVEGIGAKRAAGYGRLQLILSDR